MDTIEEIAKAFEQFKAYNDARLKEIEKTGSASAATQSAVDKANADISALQDRLKAENDKTTEKLNELEDRVNRNATRGRGEKHDDDYTEHVAKWQAGVQGVEEIDPSDVDWEFKKAYKPALNDYLKKADKRKLNEMQVGSDPDGGYWVDADTSGRMIGFIHETSPIRGLASAEPISGDALEGPIDLGAGAGGWVGEMEARPKTSTDKVQTWRIPLREQYSMPSTTQRLLDLSGRDVGAWLTNKSQRRFARDEASAFVSGDTPLKPRGFLTYTAGVPGSTIETWPFVEQVASGIADSIAQDNLINFVYSLKTEFTPVMGMRRDTERIIRQMKDGNGDYVWQPDFTERRQGRVLGVPVVDMPDMPAVQANALAIVLADFAEAYQIVDSTTGIRVLRDDLTEKGKVLFYMTRYVGGDVLNFEAIKLLKIAAS